MKFWKSIFKRLEQETEIRRASLYQPSLINNVFLLGVLAIIVLIVWFFSSQINYYVDFISDVNKKPGVHNLTKAGLEWDVYYGNSQKCGSIDCHLKSDFSQENYLKQMVLPAREFPLKDYKKGQLIYLRTKLKVPKSILEYDAIALYSVYIWAKHYEVYFNETIAATGVEETLYISIPKEVIDSNGELNIAFKIDPGNLSYQGIANQLDLYIGSQKAFGRAMHQSFELKTVFFMWFLIPRLLIGMIFALMFTIIYRHREIAIFVLYTFISSLAILANTAFVPDWMSSITHLDTTYLILECFAQLILLLFVHEYFRRTSMNFNYIYVSLFTATSMICALFYLNETFRFKMIQSGTIQGLRDALEVSALLYGAVIGSITSFYLYRTGKNRLRQISVSIMAAFFLFSMFFLSYFALSSTSEIQLHARLTFQLCLYLCMSIVIAFEFGVTISRNDQEKMVKSQNIDSKAA